MLTRDSRRRLSLSADAFTVGEIREAVSTVTDPEIPVLSISDLGILRGVTVEDGEARVVITPTYSGCPAMSEIRSAIEAKLDELGVPGRVETRLSPAWTTDDMTPEAHRLLSKVGIAPPDNAVTCPLCGDEQSRMASFFGATACQALMVCVSCGEPFNHFKALRGALGQ
ncbi:MAG: phenylacetate-CoA oxygenase subunit PaaJ [Acidimicrobiia bacterium]|nr:phenylacetate-CoA oxygenase subunit PaaJ [Acidimicrobiia bacterium]